MGLSEGYATGLRSVSSITFQNWFDKGLILIGPEKSSFDESMDTSVRFFNLAQHEKAIKDQTKVYSVTLFYNSYIRGFLMTAFFLSLAIASPISLKRKAWGALIGFLLLQVFVLFRTYINLYYTLQQNPKLAIVNPSGFVQSLVIALDASLVKNIVISFIVPLILWAIVMFSREDRLLFKQLVLAKRAGKG